MTNLRLPGQYDERLFAAAGISGLQGPYYNWNRWYLPGVGRYLELDPIALAGGFNGFGTPDWYAYALGNPIRYTDPDGRAVPLVLGGICALGGCEALANLAIAGAVVVGAVGLADMLAKCTDKAPPKATGCPPCPPNPPPETDWDHPHYPCPGVHWHYRKYNQNPTTCQCFLSGRLFGGCGVAPGVVP